MEILWLLFITVICPLLIGVAVFAAIILGVCFFGWLTETDKGKSFILVVFLISLTWILGAMVGLLWTQKPGESAEQQIERLLKH